MNVKYRIKYKDWYGAQWQHDFYMDYTGDVNEVICSGNPVVYGWETANLFTHTAIHGSYAEFELMQETTDQYEELISTNKAAKVVSYRDGNVFWQGWTIADNYITQYLNGFKSIKITAIDGIGFLKNTSYTASVPTRVTIKSVLKQCFDTADLETDIYESLDVYGSGMDTDESPINQTYIDMWMFYDRDNRTYQSLYDILNCILSDWGVGAQVYLKNGDWYIDRVSQKGREITYSHYDSDFELQGTVNETNVKLLSGAKVLPTSVPVNKSLYKEVVRPYSSFNLTANYDLRENSLKYWHTFSVVPLPGLNPINPQNIQYSIEDSRITIYQPSFVPNYQHGINYYIGYVDLERTRTDIEDTLFAFTITGELKGWFRVKLFIEDEVTGDTYYYTNYYEDGEVTIKSVWSKQDMRNIPGLQDVISINKKDELESFNETSNVTRGVADRSYIRGQMYLQILPPYNYAPGNIPPAIVHVYLKDIQLKYFECVKLNEKINISVSALTNKKEHDTKLYSNPSYLLQQRSSSGFVNSYYNYRNPHLVYPGILYTKSGAVYTPITNYFIKDINDNKALERILAEDIMTYYSVPRLKLTGTLLTEIDFGQIIEYHSRFYLIMSLILHTRSSFADVILFEISKEEGFLLDEDGEYVLDENEQPIKI